jgi:hypothetical protein
MPKLGETITGVALLNDDGTMIALPRPHRHFHLYALAAFCGLDFHHAKEGFTTSCGEFADRETARAVVQLANQPNRKSGAQNSTELFSEDVW